MGLGERAINGSRGADTLGANRQVIVDACIDGSGQNATRFINIAVSGLQKGGYGRKESC